MIEGHGDDGYRYKREIVSNFSSNVFNRVDLTALKQHLCEHIACIGAYPEPAPFTLEREIAQRAGINAEEVSVTNGATEAIYLIAQWSRGKKTTILDPTFSEYRDACRVHEHPLCSVERLEDVANNCEMVWLCNPNNPTGGVLPKAKLSEWVRKHPWITVVIDQSYGFFTNEELLSTKEGVAFPNVILLHSMTKHFAIPGLRLGYFTANATLVKAICRHRMPWSVNSMAITAGLFLMQHPLTGNVNRAVYLQEAQELRKQLNQLEGIEITPTSTHFMLGKLKRGSAVELKNYLANEHGILIRDASNFNHLDSRFFRIATQTKEENEQLVEAIRTWLAQVKE